jgi:hypothetical protein
MNTAVTAPTPTSQPANNASAVGFGLDEFSTSVSAETIFTGDHATTIAGGTSSASNIPQLPAMDCPPTSSGAGEYPPSRIRSAHRLPL